MKRLSRKWFRTLQFQTEQTSLLVINRPQQTVEQIDIISLIIIKIAGKGKHHFGQRGCVCAEPIYKDRWIYNGKFGEFIFVSCFRHFKFFN